MLNKRLQVAYTHAHAYMWHPVPQGSWRFFCLLYIPGMNIRRVCHDESVTLFRTGSLVTGNDCCHLERLKVKYACINLHAQM